MFRRRLAAVGVQTSGHHADALAVDGLGVAVHVEYRHAVLVEAGVGHEVGRVLHGHCHVSVGPAVEATITTLTRISYRSSSTLG